MRTPHRHLVSGMLAVMICLLPAVILAIASGSPIAEALLRTAACCR